jgi:hypothetical protein
MDGTFLSYYSPDDTSNYEHLKDRISEWCNKLYQDGVYTYTQYQKCLDNLDSGAAEFNKKTDENYDENKDLERIYGYYKKDKEKINIDTANPNNMIIEDDFQKMTLYHNIKNKFLICDKNDVLSLDNNPDDVESKDWRLISLGKKDETNVYAIMSKYGKYIIGNDDGSVLVNSKILNTWCQWKMVKYNNAFGFQSVVHKKYLAPVGDELLLMDGWTDNNLWILKKKEISTGKNFIQYDNSSLMTKKDKLLNRMNNYYNNYLNYKYESEYYNQKLKQLMVIRNNQMDYLMDIADNNLQILKDSKNNIKKNQQNPEFTGIEENDNLINQYYSNCFMDKVCIQRALEYSKRTLVTDSTREEKINKDDCDWNSQQIDDIIKYKFKEPTKDYCDSLGNRVDNILQRDINDKITQLEMYKNDVQIVFDKLKQKEYQDLHSLIETSNTNRDENYNEYTKSLDEVNQFIKSLNIAINKTENTIYNLTDSLDIKLEKQNKIDSEIAINQPPKSYDDLTNIINSNFEIAKSNHIKQRKWYVYLVLEIIVVLIIIGYFTYKSLKKYGVIGA